jgi:hypothetical protein
MISAVDVSNTEHELPPFGTASSARNRADSLLNVFPTTVNRQSAATKLNANSMTAASVVFWQEGSRKILPQIGAKFCLLAGGFSICNA